MDTENLRTFLTLAQVKNFTQTAKQLFVAQSTVTNRIAELEREVGKKLFSRNNRLVELSREGQVFLPYASRILELEATCLQELHGIKKYEAYLQIGTTNTIYESHLFKEVQRLRKDKPGTAVKITLGHSAELLLMLTDGTLDMVYTYMPLWKKGYDCTLFRQERLLLVTDGENQRFQNGIRKEELPDANYYMCNFMLQEVGAFIRELFPPYYQFVFEIDNSTKLLPYLFHSDGCSFLSETMVKEYIEDGSLREIPLLDFQVPVVNSYCVKKSKPVPFE